MFEGDKDTWKARAIYAKKYSCYSNINTEYYFDIVPDRQGGGPNEMIIWLNDFGLNALQQKFNQHCVTPDSHDCLIVQDDQFKLEGTCNGSYGYVYLRCSRKNTSESPKGSDEKNIVAQKL